MFLGKQSHAVLFSLTPIYLNHYSILIQIGQFQGQYFPYPHTHRIPHQQQALVLQNGHGLQQPLHFFTQYHRQGLLLFGRSTE